MNKETQTGYFADEVSSWLNRVSGPKFDRFRQLHTDYSPHSLWIQSKESCHLLAISRPSLQIIAGMAETALSHARCQFCNIDLHTNAIDHYFHSCSYLAERVSLWYNILQLNDNVYVHLMNLECEYVLLVLLGLEDDDAISLLLGDQSQRFRHLCMSGLHKVWSKVNRYTR